jgi:S1-C subfamily serine protease
MTFPDDPTGPPAQAPDPTVPQGVPGAEPAGTRSGPSLPVIAGLGVAVAAALSGAAIAHFAWPGSSQPPATFQLPFNSPQSNFPSQSSAPSPTSATTASVASKVDPGIVDINTNIAVADGGSEAAGTGMVISSGGVVLTNNHVIAEASQISAYDIGNGKTYVGHVVGYDRTHDVAVVQLQNASGLATVPLGDSSKVRVGQSVVTIGNAGGIGGTPTTAGGSVAALGQRIRAGDELDNAFEQLTNLIEVDGSLQPGDSGGPLATAQGKVVGMDTAASAGFSFQSSSGQGYAIPIDQALSIARLILDGKGSSTIHIGATPMLGVKVETQPLTVGGNTPNGAVVQTAVAGTPAANAGLTQNDTIIALGGQAITSSSSLVAVKDRYHPGDKVQVVWLDPENVRHSATITLATGSPD